MYTYMMTARKYMEMALAAAEPLEGEGQGRVTGRDVRRKVSAGDVDAHSATTVPPSSKHHQLPYL